MAKVTRLPVRRDGDGDDDSVIIQRSRTEPEVFATVFDRYYPEIHGHAARRLGRGLADDVAAETFLVAFHRRERYDLTRPSARPWLYGIASNLIARHRRAEERLYRALARTAVEEATEGTPTGSRRGWTPKRSGNGWPRSWPSCRAATATCCCWSPGRT